MYTIGSVCLWLTAGCGDVLTPGPAPLFRMPLSIEGVPIGPGVIDTGGGYELMLRESFGLKIIGTAEVLAFGGVETVDVTEGFTYTAGGWEAAADAALVGVSVCDCNGVGFHFFRKSGAVLALDFPTGQVALLPGAPEGGVAIPFEQPPASLADFYSAFVDVEVTADGNSRIVRGLIDTGTNATVMRRGVIGTPFLLTPNRLEVAVAHPDLGTVEVQVTLFDTAGLPDIIIGTDVMGVWSDRWYFSFTRDGGMITVFPHTERDPQPTTSVPVTADRRETS